MSRTMMPRTMMPRILRALLLTTMTCLFLVGGVPASGQLEPSPNTVIRPASPEACALLDDPQMRAAMDGLFLNLVWSCGRQDEFLDLQAEKERLAEKAPRANRTEAGRVVPKHPISQQLDATVSDRSGESHPSASQSETTLAEDETSGILCSAFNDSWEFYSGGGGFTGFSRSTDGGATWQDGGAVGGTTLGDPSLVWRRADGNFYLATLSSGGGLEIRVSDDGCQSFTTLRTVASVLADDKEFLAVDNRITSPNYGNMYLVWTGLRVNGTSILSSRSTDGGLTWSAPATMFSVVSPTLVQGAWPAVAPNGDVYVAIMHVINFPGGNVSTLVFRSTDGGQTYIFRSAPLNGATTPRQLAATATCGIPALNGNIRILPSPQLAVDDQGRLHLVYSRDPDGIPGSGDNIDVYYRRSVDGAFTWGPEIRLNDDTTTNDQYHPTIQVRGNTVMATWNDRRRDPNNLNFGYFKRVSTDGGQTWFPNVRVSNGTFGIVLDPGTAACYHGDYDQALIASDQSQIAQWSDDRAGDPDVYAESSNCFDGSTAGPWKLPTTAPQLLSGTVSGLQSGDPVLYQISAQAFPNGQISGSMLGTAPNSTPLNISGQWKLDTSTVTGPPRGRWTAQIQSASTPGNIGTISAAWSLPATPSLTAGRFKGTWRICLQ